MSEKNKEIIIIGGGIVGLTIAYQVIKRGISKNIIILEKENNLGLHTSGRNSGVLHAGIYYKPGSLKSDEFACVIPSPLAISYTLAALASASSIKTIILAGFQKNSFSSTALANTQKRKTKHQL